MYVYIYGYDIYTYIQTYIYIYIWCIWYIYILYMEHGPLIRPGFCSSLCVHLGGVDDATPSRRQRISEGTKICHGDFIGLLQPWNMPKNRGLKHQIIDFEPSKWKVQCHFAGKTQDWTITDWDWSIMAVTNNDRHSFWGFNLFQEPISILYLVIPYGECQRKNRNFKAFRSIEIGCGLSLYLICIPDLILSAMWHGFLQVFLVWAYQHILCTWCAVRKKP